MSSDCLQLLANHVLVDQNDLAAIRNIAEDFELNPQSTNTIETLCGDQLIVMKTTDNQLMLQAVGSERPPATITVSNIKKCGGIIHIIDDVLIPEDFEGVLSVSPTNVTKPPVTGVPVSGVPASGVPANVTEMPGVCVPVTPTNVTEMPGVPVPVVLQPKAPASAPGGNGDAAPGGYGEEDPVLTLEVRAKYVEMSISSKRSSATLPALFVEETDAS